MKKTALALLAAGLSSGALSACGEKHEILGSRAGADGGGPAGGTAGSGGGATGGGGGAGGTTGGGPSGGSGSGAGSGASGAGASAAGAGGAGGAAGAGVAGSAGAVGGTSGRGGSGGSGDAGATSGASGGAGEGGASTGGTAGTGAGGTGGAAPACPADCTSGTSAGCAAGQVSWTCGNGFDYQEFIDAGCTDQATGLPRFCCPPEAFSGCQPCADVATLDECQARTDCHSVFTDPGPTGCACTAVGCCTQFSRCADGDLANCVGPVACPNAQPYCADPAYVVSTVGSCFEGCVKPEDCAPQ